MSRFGLQILLTYRIRRPHKKNVYSLVAKKYRNFVVEIESNISWAKLSYGYGNHCFTYQKQNNYCFLWVYKKYAIDVVINNRSMTISLYDDRCMEIYKRSVWRQNGDELLQEIRYVLYGFYKNCNVITEWMNYIG